MSSETDELLEQLFPEQSKAEQVLALATAMELDRIDVDGQSRLYFKIVGHVPIGRSDLRGKSGERLLHFGKLLGVMKFNIDDQGKARAAASKSRRRRTTGRKTGKGGAK